MSLSLCAAFMIPGVCLCVLVCVFVCVSVCHHVTVHQNHQVLPFVMITSVVTARPPTTSENLKFYFVLFLSLIMNLKSFSLLFQIPSSTQPGSPFVLTPVSVNLQMFLISKQSV